SRLDYAMLLFGSLLVFGSCVSAQETIAEIAILRKSTNRTVLLPGEDARLDHARAVFTGAELAKRGDQMRSGRFPGGSSDEQIRFRRLVPDAVTNRLLSGRIRAKVVAAD